jgi:hypothetical protein
MRYVKTSEELPRDDVDVIVVTSSGAKGVARYRSTIGRWLIKDHSLPPNDVVKKWKYMDAVIFSHELIQ